jgi:hypothetical protein
MQQSGVRRVFYYAGSVFCVTGTLLLLGSIVGSAIGWGAIKDFYDNNKPLVFSALGGLVLLALGIYFSALGAGRDLVAIATPTGTTQGKPSPEDHASSEGAIRCDKCEAINDGDAKFCDQCGTSLTGGSSETAYRAAR